MRASIILLFFLISSFDLFGQEDFKKITTYKNDSSEIVYKYFKGDSCICSSIIDTIENREIFTIADVKPLFGGCSSEDESYINIINYIKKNINYPHYGGENMIIGKIIIKCIIDIDGRITGFQVLKGLNAWNEEAIRVIKSMPKWESAKCNGKKVPYYFTFPVNINPD